MKMLIKATMSRSFWSKEEGGWALLGVLLALGIIAIVMLRMVPNIQTQVRRDKEAELIYRGEQMAEGIARYYNRGLLGAVQLQVPPPYGYLYELEKLREGVTLGINEIRFVRMSAMIDPVSNQEWEPVRFRDPRLSFAIQAYATAKQVPIPPSLMMIAGPPTGIRLGDTEETPVRPESPAPETPVRPGVAERPQGANPDPDNDDDDDDEQNFDPLGHLIQAGQSIPIVAVAPRLKGASVRPLYGMKSYDEWVFIYIPPVQVRPNVRINPNPQPSRFPRNPQR